MFKKLVAIFITAVVLCTSFLTVIPVSAASGTDISETFEFYGSMDGVDPTDLLRTFWVGGGCLTNKNSIDETKSAPNRGNGKSKGNYRSMKMDIKFVGGGDGTWGSCRINTHEDWAAVKEGIEKMDKSLSYSFWADVEKPMDVKASIDINNVPFFKRISLTPGWKQYTLKLDELEPATDKYGEGVGIFGVQEKAGNGGWKYPFFCGFKFEVFADWQEAQENTFWVDTFAIHGNTITERTEYKVEVGTTIYPTDFDEDGSVPKNFVPDNSSDKDESTVSSNKGNTTTSSKKDTTTSSKKDNATSSKKDNATSSKKDNATSSKKDNTSKKNDTSNKNDSSDVLDTNTSDVTDSNEPNVENNDNQDSSTNTDSKQESSKLDIGLFLTIIFGSALVIGNALAFILFAVRKKSK